MRHKMWLTITSKDQPWNMFFFNHPPLETLINRALMIKVVKNFKYPSFASTVFTVGKSWLIFCSWDFIHSTGSNNFFLLTIEGILVVARQKRIDLTDAEKLLYLQRQFLIDIAIRSNTWINGEIFFFKDYIRHCLAQLPDPSMCPRGRRRIKGAKLICQSWTKFVKPHLKAWLKTTAKSLKMSQREKKENPTKSPSVPPKSDTRETMP